ncbi:MAG: hypothetical protein R3E09_01705 [Novosphingobium sp.]|nr:hypothetical protein [Novosphingobium sp.]
MDSLRGHYSDPGETGHDAGDYDRNEDETGREPPPAAIGQDERRMQVRAYNHWASLLGDRHFPAIEDLKPQNLPDFGPYSVLLDFTGGIENPAVAYLGETLAEECGAEGEIGHLEDVPSRSLLSRITDHYMQILANQAPIGFEAEFVNQRGATILYRGILLPFSSNDETINFIYGVINWKELADQHTADELLLEIDQALNPSLETRRNQGPLTEWADGPADTSSILELATPVPSEGSGLDWPEPAFGGEGSDAPLADGEDEDISDEAAQDMALADWLASARELAQAARGSEERSRQALYAAIGRAYDFSIAASAAPAEFEALVADAGLTVQNRAPMTPLVKLVFGADYDKTRLTEYASALGHAHRLGLARGTLAEYLSGAEGGLKGVVNAERRLRREESGTASAVARKAPRETLSRKLRNLETHSLGNVAREGAEFALLVARRLPTGEVVLLGEVTEDVRLLERAARHLLK